MPIVRSMSQHIRDEGFDVIECTSLEPWRTRVRIASNLDDQNLSPVAVLEGILKPRPGYVR
jgi:hypothetical protein